jgi:hypothetical protein
MSTKGLVFYYDMYNVKSYKGAPVTNLLPGGTTNAYPSTGNGWGTYNTNQYNSNTYFSIGSISSVTGNVVVTAAGHPLRSYDVVTPQTSGGGVTAGTNYLVKKLSSNSFSLHSYNSSQDGSSGFSVYNSYNNNTQISINSTSFPTMWWGPPHLPNSGLVKEIIRNGFRHKDRIHDCVRLHYIRSDGVADGMSYGVDTTVTPGVAHTVSFYVKAATPTAVGKSISYQIYNYTGGSAAGYSFNFTLTAEWQKVYMTFTPAYGTCISYWFSNSSPPYSWDLSEIMFTTGSTPTEYTESTRSTTGVLADLSNKSSITANSLTYGVDGNFSFNGSSNYITVTPNSAFDLYSLQFWMYNNNAVPNNDGAIGGPSSYQSPINFNSVGTYGINLGGWTGGATNEAFHIWSATAGGLMTYNQIAAPVGWHHVVFNWNGTTYDIWLDGVKTTTYAHSSGHAKLANITSLRIGGDVTAGYYFNGRITSVKCHNVQLTDEEVLQGFNTQRLRYGI